MPPQSRKPDASFFQKLAAGAIGSRTVIEDLNGRGHDMRELENGSTDTKIWKDPKRKRVRMPDLLCIRCGLRVESRAKSKSELSMSHSRADAERAWDFGMVDSDVVAFPLCHSTPVEDWDRGRLRNHTSYWHQRERLRWSASRYINYFRVSAFRSVSPSKSATKGAEEGSETSIAWDAIFAKQTGAIQELRGSVIVARWESGNRPSFLNRKALPVFVAAGEQVEAHQVIASVVPPLSPDELRCPGDLTHGHIHTLLLSPERTQQFSGIKLARLRNEPEFEEPVRRLAEHPDSDPYVRLEAVAYLTRVCGGDAEKLFARFLEYPDDQLKLEAIIALAEAATPAAVALLAAILDDEVSPYFLRSAAAWALGRVGTTAAVDRLVRAFADVSVEIREEALDSLGSLRDPALAQLLAGLRSGDSRIAAGCAEALRRGGPLPEETLLSLVDTVRQDDELVWGLWLIGSQTGSRRRISELLKGPEAVPEHVAYAITVLWSFVDSWIAAHWEIHPDADRT